MVQHNWPGFGYSLVVQGSPKTLRIAKTAAAATVVAAVAMKKEQRLPCPKGQRRRTTNTM